MLSRDEDNGIALLSERRGMSEAARLISSLFDSPLLEHHNIRSFCLTLEGV